MTLVYRVLSLLLGLLASRLANKVTRKVWGAVAKGNDVPKPTSRRASVGEIAASAAITGAVMKTTRSLTERAGAKGFEKATGTWPGKA